MDSLARSASAAVVGMGVVEVTEVRVGDSRRWRCDAEDLRLVLQIPHVHAVRGRVVLPERRRGTQVPTPRAEGQQPRRAAALAASKGGVGRVKFSCIGRGVKRSGRADGCEEVETAQKLTCVVCEGDGAVSGTRDDDLETGFDSGRK